jgi:hypothetical protein
MQEQVLLVGDELVIEGSFRLTLLAVEAGEVLLAITAPEPSDVAGPEDGSARVSPSPDGAHLRHRWTSDEATPPQ